MNLSSRMNMLSGESDLLEKVEKRLIRKKIFVFLCLTASSILMSACSQSSTKPSITTQIKEPTSSTQTSYLKELLEAEFLLQREGPSKAFEAFYKISKQSKSLQAIERLTDVAIATQNSLNIERSANLWLSKTPSSEQAYALKFQVLVKANREEEAATLLTNAIRHKVNMRFLPLYLSENLQDNEQISTINNIIDLLIPSSKNNIYVELSNAQIALISGEYQSAKDIAEKLITTPSLKSNETLYLILALSQDHLGQSNKAIDTLLDASKNIPSSRRVLTSLLDLLVKGQQAQEAMNLYAQSNFSDYAQAKLGLSFATSLLENQYPNEALTVLDELQLPLFGLTEQATYLKALALAASGKKNDAIVLMNDIKQGLRSNATNQIAIWLYDEDKADDINQMVLERTLPANIQEKALSISLLHEEKGHTDLAIELLNDSLTLYPQLVNLKYHKALLSESIGNWTETEKELKELIKETPLNPRYLNALGYTLLTRTDRIDEAMSYIGLAYQQDDKDPAIIDSLGWGLFMKGEFEEASYYLEKAWNILHDAEIASHYGEALWAQKEYTRAKNIWKQALEKAPNSPVLIETINRLSPSLLDGSLPDEKTEKTS